MTRTGFYKCQRLALQTIKLFSICALSATFVSPTLVQAQPRIQPPVAPPPAPDNPLVARYDGGQVTLHTVEEFAREMPLVERVPFTRNAGDWRRYMAGELAKITALTSQAKSMGYQMDPGYLRARDYFINEYLDYLVLRDHVHNKLDLSSTRQQQEYETHKEDFWASQTVTFRMIRTRDQQKIAEAAKKLQDGADFRTVEMEYSQSSPRFRGTVLGPFPTRERQSVIPPPQPVIDAALKLDEGQTTGPLNFHGFHYIIKTEEKTAGRQRSQEEVTEELVERLRARQSAQIVPDLIDQIQRDLDVQADEQLFAESTNPDDVLATIGAFRLKRQEYIDLNGSPRGPAVNIARTMPTPLKQFIIPYLLAEWAKARGYMDRPETRKAIHYYDLQHLAAKIDMEIGMQVMPLPSDDELRQRFERDKHELRRPGAPEPRFEDHKEDMINSILQARAPEADRLVRQLVLQQLNFQANPNPTSTNITAMEALVKARDQLSSGAMLVEISPAQLPLVEGTTLYHDIGRAPQWRIVTTTPDGNSQTVQVSGPAPLLEGRKDFADIPAMERWMELWRFDTDALKRHAVDEAYGDFAAKYNHRVKVAARINFSYSKDDRTSPTGALITYTAVPADAAVQDGLEFAYAAGTGDVAHEHFGAKPRRCLTCRGGVDENAPAPSAHISNPVKEAGTQELNSESHTTSSKAVESITR